MYFLILYMEIVVFIRSLLSYLCGKLSQNVMNIDIEVRNKRERFESNVR